MSEFVSILEYNLWLGLVVCVALAVLPCTLADCKIRYFTLAGYGYRWVCVFSVSETCINALLCCFVRGKSECACVCITGLQRHHTDSHSQCLHFATVFRQAKEPHRTYPNMYAWVSLVCAFLVRSPSAVSSLSRPLNSPLPSHWVCFSFDALCEWCPLFVVVS